MKLGKVIGKVISNQREGRLENLKISVVRYLDANMNETKKTVACIDTLNADDGEVVLVCSSSSARITKQTENTATDCAIVGIVDSISQGKGDSYNKGESR
jgi:microcompartment protein CcmK/EutM